MRTVLPLQPQLHSTSHHPPPRCRTLLLSTSRHGPGPSWLPALLPKSGMCVLHSASLTKVPLPQHRRILRDTLDSGCSSNHPSHSPVRSPGFNPFGLPLRVSPSGAHPPGLHRHRHPRPPHRAARPTRRQPGGSGSSPPPGAACVYPLLPVTAAAGPCPHSNAGGLGRGPSGDGGVRRGSPGARYGGERWGTPTRRAPCVPRGLHTAAGLQDPSRLLQQPWPQPLPQARRGARAGRRRAGRAAFSSGTRPPLRDEASPCSSHCGGPRPP